MVIITIGNGKQWCVQKQFDLLYIMCCVCYIVLSSFVNKVNCFHCMKMGSVIASSENACFLLSVDLILFICKQILEGYTGL